MLWGKSVGAPDGAAAPHEVAWPARANRRHRGRNRDGRQRLPGVGGQPGNAGAAALRGMRQATSAQLHCVLAICDQGLGSCAVGAARVLEGPVRHGPLERLPVMTSSLPRFTHCNTLRREAPSRRIASIIRNVVWQAYRHEANRQYLCEPDSLECNGRDLLRGPESVLDPATDRRGHHSQPLRRLPHA